MILVDENGYREKREEEYKSEIQREGGGGGRERGKQ